MTSIKYNTLRILLSSDMDGNLTSSRNILKRNASDAIIPTIMTIFIALGLSANLIVIKLTVSYAILKGCLGKYIVNQAVCNICLSAVPSMAYLIEKAMGAWTFGGTVCNVIVTIEYAVLTTSSALLVIKCYEQYVAINNPLKMRHFQSRRIPILISWLFGLAIAIPFVSMESRLTKQNGRYTCNDLLAFSPEKKKSSYAYFIVIFTTAFVIPLITVVCLYGRMIYVLLRKRRRPGEILPQIECRDKRRKLKIVKMLIANAILFQVCWLPSYIQEFLMMSNHVDSDGNREKTLNVCVSIIGYGYATVDPFVYFTFMKKYRKALTYFIDDVKKAVGCAKRGDTRRKRNHESCQIEMKTR